MNVEYYNKTYNENIDILGYLSLQQSKSSVTVSVQIATIAVSM